MTRRLFATGLFLILFASTAWPRLKQEEQEYFDNQFHAVLEQVQALGKQVQALSTRLEEAQLNQAQLQEALTHEQRSLQDLQQLVSSMRTVNEENLASLKTALSQMRAETQKSLSALAGRPTEVTAVGSTMAPGLIPPSPSAVQAYITSVQGSEVVIDQGSAKGLRVGSRLGFYKASDPNTRAGSLEVTEILDAGNSHAKIVTINAGVRPEFGDIVRLE